MLLLNIEHLINTHEKKGQKCHEINLVIKTVTGILWDPTGENNGDRERNTSVGWLCSKLQKTNKQTNREFKQWQSRGAIFRHYIITCCNYYCSLEQWLYNTHECNWHPAPFNHKWPALVWHPPCLSWPWSYCLPEREPSLPYLQRWLN